MLTYQSDHNAQSIELNTVTVLNTCIKALSKQECRKIETNLYIALII